MFFSTNLTPILSPILACFAQFSTDILTMFLSPKFQALQGKWYQSQKFCTRFDHETTWSPVNTTDFAWLCLPLLIIIFYYNIPYRSWIKKPASQCNLDLWKYTQAHRWCLHEIDPNKSSRILGFQNKIIWNALCFTKKYLEHTASTAIYPPLSKFLWIYNTALWFSENAGWWAQHQVFDDKEVWSVKSKVGFRLGTRNFALRCKSIQSVVFQII